MTDEIPKRSQLDWMDRASCREDGVDPRIFVAENRAGIQQAKGYCGRCPVRLSCIAYAMEHARQDVGIYGGMTLGEREAYRARMPRFV